MPLTFSRRPLIAAALCAALPGASLLLSGCASTPVASAVPASEAPQKNKKPEPVLMPMPTIDAFKGAGIFYFDARSSSSRTTSPSTAAMPFRKTSRSEAATASRGAAARPPF